MTIPGSKIHATAFARERRHSHATGMTKRIIGDRSRKVSYYNNATWWWSQWVREGQ